MNYKELTNLGLSEKESKVYLSSLKLGKSSVQNIAKNAKVNRATTYVIINSLIEKGLMSSYSEGKKQFFIAESPEKLNLLFREQEIEIKKKQEYLKNILPQLKALKTEDSNGPVVRYYEGKDGLRATSEELYISKNIRTLRTIYSADLLTKIFTKEELAEFRKRRRNKKIKVRAILNDSKNQIQSDAKMIKVPASKYNIKSDIAFYGDITRIVTMKKPYYGLIIKNKDITQTLKILFDLAWKYLLSKKEGQLDN